MVCLFVSQEFVPEFPAWQTLLEIYAIIDYDK